MTTPESRRAIKRPRRRPEVTIERAVARRCTGARSPTRGSTVQSSKVESLAELRMVYILNCGVTVVKAVRNERKLNTGNEFVMHSPILGTNSHISINAANIQAMDPLTKK